MQEFLASIPNWALLVGAVVLLVVGNAARFLPLLAEFVPSPKFFKGLFSSPAPVKPTASVLLQSLIEIREQAGLIGETEAAQHIGDAIKSLLELDADA